MVRAVATFIHMYPRYKPQEALEELAIVFYTLLEEAYRQRHEHYLMLAQIATLPMSSVDQVNAFMKQLEYSSKPLGDILKSSGEGSDPADIKKLLNG